MFDGVKRICFFTNLESIGYRKKREFINHNADIIVGLGGTANLDIASSQRPEALILFDFNQNLCDFWGVFKEVISQSRDKQDFLEKLKQNMIGQSYVCANTYDGQEDKLNSVELVAQEVVNLIKKSEWFRGKGIFENDENFNFIKSLFSSEKVKIHKIDLTKEDDISALENLISNTKSELFAEGKSSNKIILNLLNSIDFILGRMGRNFAPDKRYSDINDLFGNYEKVSKSKGLIKRFTNFLEDSFGNENALILDAFYPITEIKNSPNRAQSGSVRHKDFHTNMFYPADFRQFRILDDLNSYPGAVNKSAKSMSQTLASIDETPTYSTYRGNIAEHHYNEASAAIKTLENSTNREEREKITKWILASLKSATLGGHKPAFKKYADKLVEIGRKEEALDYYYKGAEAGDEQCHYEIGYMEKTRGNHAAAIKHLAKATLFITFYTMPRQNLVQYPIKNFKEGVRNLNPEEALEVYKIFSSEVGVSDKLTYRGKFSFLRSEIEAKLEKLDNLGYDEIKFRNSNSEQLKAVKGGAKEILGIDDVIAKISSRNNSSSTDLELQNVSKAEQDFELKVRANQTTLTTDLGENTLRAPEETDNSSKISSANKKEIPNSSIIVSAETQQSLKPEGRGH